MLFQFLMQNEYLFFSYSAKYHLFRQNFQLGLNAEIAAFTGKNLKTVIWISAQITKFRAQINVTN